MDRHTEDFLKHANDVVEEIKKQVATVEEEVQAAQERAKQVAMDPCHHNLLQPPQAPEGETAD